ncbi:MAG TPA: tRNA uridine-5-carboxymethylaminomethyl(34) synthesis GTPase MnmE [Geobacteraceae bacterium]|nr:tRNA uridine-5-carboxymethylaminomethyl(34) synthesis GTPase MnmE [Geobacteraceae bacterium]
MYVQDTIAAISTPLGEGGIGVIRVSGPEAGRIAGTIFRRKQNGGLTSHRFYYGTIIDPATDDTIDEALLVYMRAPHSYTREDVVEIQCHGGYLVVQRLLALVLGEGARLAEPGEFTKRAFLNGRIDLVQAEAVIDVIRSKTDAALALAQHQREGMLSQRIAAVRERLLHALALVEAHIDFPEDEVGSLTVAEIGRLTEEGRGEIGALLAGFSEGKVLREGVAVLIAGKPNVGKSSLLNTLLREKRAIVTSVPGTTRDIIEEVVNIGGLPVRMLDTAGVRETDDVVEREGVRRTLERIPLADLVLFMVDGARSFDDEDRMILDALGAARAILVVNKSDLPAVIELPAELAARETVAVSTLTGEGIDQVRTAIRDSFLHGRAVDGREFVALSQARHRDALVRALGFLVRFAESLGSGAELELLALELREALDAVGEVTGETTPDEVLDLIFSRFCIGK